jgi:tRNA(His) guanylyltransferase
MNGKNILIRNNMKDDLGKRMKEQYEQRSRTFLPRRTYTIIRLDGKAFHTFTRGMEKPFDLGLICVMNAVTVFLCENIQGAQLAYTQSDEISILLTDFDKITTDAWFDGNVQKIVSVSASMATAKFNDESRKTFAAPKGLAFFDSRAFTISDPTEVENYFIWRQKDAVRNSVAMTAQSLYSHKELNGKSSNEQQEMCFQKGVNWNDLNEGFKRGRTVANFDPGDLTVNGPTGWTIITPDFLKERETLSAFIPKIVKE